MLNKSLQSISSDRFDYSGKAASLQPASAHDLAKLLPDFLNTIVSVYMKAIGSIENAPSQITFSECVIRYTKLLTVLQSNDGHLSSCILSRVLDEQPIADLRINASMSANHLISRTTIAQFLFQALPRDDLASISPIDNIYVLSGMAMAFSELRLHRKKAFLMKELIAVILPVLVQARKAGAVDMGVHPATGLTALAMDLTNKLSGAEDDVRYRLDKFLGFFARLYGIPDFDSFAQVTMVDDDGRYRERPVKLYQSRESGSLLMKMNILRICIDYCEALPDLYGVINFSAMLLALATPYKIIKSIDYDGSVPLSREEQIHLATNISKTIEVVNTLEMHDVKCDYWDDFLLRDITAKNDETLRTGTELRELDKNMTSRSKMSDKKNPFIHSALSKKAEQNSAPYVVAGQECAIEITLQNPYDFEVMIDRIQVCSIGASFELNARSFHLPSLSTKVFSIKATPKEAGQSEIMGCVIKVAGCKERLFYRYPEKWYPEFDSRVKSLTSNTSSVVTLLENVVSTSKDIEADCSLKPITSLVKVLPKQPQIIMMEISLPQASLVLLEGERRKVTITLFNVSPDVSANYVVVSYHDSITEEVESVLADNKASEPEFHEAQYMLQARQIIKSLRSATSVEARQLGYFSFEVYGVLGLHKALARYYYTHQADEQTECFPKFVKQLEVPLEISVDPSVSLENYYLIDIPQYEAVRIGKSTNQKIKVQSLTKNIVGSRVYGEEKTVNHNELIHSLNSISRKEEYCLLVLDLRNNWSNPLSVRLRTVSANPSLHTSDRTLISVSTDVVAPGTVSRVSVVVPKIYITDSYTPIPSIGSKQQRQFVVKAHRTSPAADDATLKAFWYRKKLLEMIEGSWQDEHSRRSGAVNLRGIRLDSKMISVLQLDDIDIDVAILEDTGSRLGNPAVRRFGGSKFIVQLNRFFTLRVQLRNRSTSPIRPVLRLQPRLADQISSSVAISLESCLAFGSSTQRVLPVLGPHKVIESDIGVCCLARGTFEIVATVEEFEKTCELRSGDKIVNGEGIEESELSATIKPRMWQSRDTCCIVAE